MNENSDRGILASVQKMTGTYNLDQLYLVTGTCKNINEAAGTCDVDAISGNATTTISGVKFQAAIGDGVDFVPVDGSVVKVLFSKYTTPFIVQYSDIDKMILAANSGINHYDDYAFDCDKIVFNQGANDGLVKVVPLKTKLNNLESDLNNLKTLLSTMIAAMQAVPAGNVSHTELIGYFTPLLPYTTQVLIPTQKSEIEDTKFKH